MWMRFVGFHIFYREFHAFVLTDRRSKSPGRRRRAQSHGKRSEARSSLLTDISTESTEKGPSFLKKYKSQGPTTDSSAVIQPNDVFEIGKKRKKSKLMKHWKGKETAASESDENKLFLPTIEKQGSTVTFASELVSISEDSLSGQERHRGPSIIPKDDQAVTLQSPLSVQRISARTFHSANPSGLRSMEATPRRSGEPGAQPDIDLSPISRPFAESQTSLDLSTYNDSERPRSFQQAKSDVEFVAASLAVTIPQFQPTATHQGGYSFRPYRKSSQDVFNTKSSWIPSGSEDYDEDYEKDYERVKRRRISNKSTVSNRAASFLPRRKRRRDPQQKKEISMDPSEIASLLSSHLDDEPPKTDPIKTSDEKIVSWLQSLLEQLRGIRNKSEANSNVSGPLDSTPPDVPPNSLINKPWRKSRRGSWHGFTRPLTSGVTRPSRILVYRMPKCTHVTSPDSFLPLRIGKSKEILFSRSSHSSTEPHSDDTLADLNHHVSKS